jgi:tripartite-type tricarboxylate transporter receptor subunit TctC
MSKAPHQDPAHLSRRALLGGLGVLAAGPALAQSRPPGFPNRAVRLILPTAPGGSADIVARIIGQGMQETLGQSMVIEPRPGAGGLLASEYVAGQPPDGHILGFSSLSGAVLNTAMQERPTFDPRRALAAVSIVGLLPQVIVVNPNLPVRTLQELIALMRAQPGRVTYASSGPGTILHLGVHMLAMRAGTTAEHIPYRGAGPALQDVIAGNVNMMVEGVPSLLPFIRSGAVRALAICAPTRNPGLPDVPTAAEAGLADFEVANWLAFFVAAATPAPLVKALEEGIRGATRIEAVRHRLTEAGLDVVGSTAEEATAYWDQQIRQWVPVVQASGVRG